MELGSTVVITIVETQDEASSPEVMDELVSLCGLVGMREQDMGARLTDGP